MRGFCYSSFRNSDHLAKAKGCHAKCQSSVAIMTNLLVKVLLVETLIFDCVHCSRSKSFMENCKCMRCFLHKTPEYFASFCFVYACAFFYYINAVALKPFNVRQVSTQFPFYLLLFKCVKNIRPVHNLGQISILNPLSIPHLFVNSKVFCA